MLRYSANRRLLAPISLPVDSRETLLIQGELCLGPFCFGDPPLSIGAPKLAAAFAGGIAGNAEEVRFPARGRCGAAFGGIVLDRIRGATQLPSMRWRMPCDLLDQRFDDRVEANRSLIGEESLV